MDHPFAQFVRILGKGPGASRDLTAEEAIEAFGMILRDEVEPLQLGAFLCLMRYKKETPVELAGFVEAVRREVAAPADIGAQLDWPSYADRHQQMPWFILAALLLAQNGVPVFMHGIAGYDAGFMPTRRGLAAMGIRPASNWDTVREELRQRGFSYLGLEDFAPQLQKLFQLRPLLGLRSPVNSLAREMNPAAAPSQMQGVFHPTYCLPHREAGLILGQPNLAVFKGGGGEVQCNPYKPVKVAGIQDGAAYEEDWPASLSGPVYRWRDEPLDATRLPALWRSELDFEPAEVAIRDTVAIALKLTGQAHDQTQARELAARLWQDRDRGAYPASE